MPKTDEDGDVRPVARALGWLAVLAVVLFAIVVTVGLPILCIAVTLNWFRVA